MNAQNKSLALFFNPSVYIAGAEALLMGMAVIVLAALTGSLGNIHFDGVLDTHIGMPAPFWIFLLEGILDWLSLGLVLLVLGRMISRTGFRTVDALGTQALARWPALLMSLILLPKAFQRISNDLVEQLRMGGMPKINPADAFIFAAVVAGLLLFTCWMVALMYKAFSVSCNVKGGKAIGTFVGGLLLAEIISKICIVLLFHYADTSHAAVTKSSDNPASVMQSTAQPSKPATDLSATGAAFVDLLAKKDFAAAEARFDPPMKSALPETRLRAVWEELLGKAGPYQKQLRTRIVKQGGYDVVLVTCQFEKKLIDMKVVYDSQQRVTGLWYLPGAAQ
jgi:hypothetical protein